MLAPADDKTQSTSQKTFEEGMKEMVEALKAKMPEAFFANPDDPLHAAFKAKAAVHSGPGGAMPLMGEAALAKLDELSYQKRSGKGLAYIHVPFCETRCLYCMFYQNPYKDEAADKYTDTLIKELQLWSGRAAQDASPIHALYFGGGTPTALPPENIRRIMKAVKQYLPLANDCEITMEGRIHNFTDAKMEAAIEGGVNRFSLGAQTFDTQVRQAQQRVDDRDTMIRRLEHLCSYDQAAVVIDLIYGFPGQTMQVWENDLLTASQLPLDGVDCYQLNVFERSPLARYISKGKLPPAADQHMRADMFARSVEFFTRECWLRLSNNHWGRTTRERNIYNQLAKGASDMLAFGSGGGGRLFGHSFMEHRKIGDWHDAVARGEKPIGMLIGPSDNWTMLRTISSQMELGKINLAQIGRDFNMPVVDWTRDITDQWVQAGLLRHSGDWLVQTVAGQFWHVTLAQLLMQALEWRINPEKIAANMVKTHDSGAPAGHGGHGGGHPAGVPKTGGHPAGIPKFGSRPKTMPKTVGEPAKCPHGYDVTDEAAAAAAALMKKAGHTGEKTQSKCPFHKAIDKVKAAVAHKTEGQSKCPFHHGKAEAEHPSSTMVDEALKSK